jgi:hypothetical protein
MLPRMSVRMIRSYTCLLLVALLIHLQSTAAKCISLQLTLEGEIVGIAEGLAVKVEVVSATKGDSVTDVRQEASIEKSRFHIAAWFNTTSNVASKETCDRKPHLVVVKLLSGGRVLDRQNLVVEKDFRRTKEGDYELRKMVVLHAGSSR